MGPVSFSWLGRGGMKAWRLAEWDGDCMRAGRLTVWDGDGVKSGRLTGWDMVV